METIDTYLEMAEQALRQGQVRAALERALAIVRSHPGNGRAYAVLGMAYALVGQEPEARDALADAADLAPKDARVRYYYYMALAKMGDREGARAQLAYFTQLDPMNEQAKAMLQRLGGPPRDLPPLDQPQVGALWFDAGGRALTDARDIAHSMLEDAEPPLGPNVLVCPECEKRTYRGMVCSHCGALLPRG